MYRNISKNNKVLAVSKMRKAFTLIELVVAVALLAMVMTFSAVIFKVSINSYRTATANAEIMQKLRAVTDQLNRDFRGIRKDAPLLIWFEQENKNDPNRYDQIMFFANGDFQSTQLYDDFTNDPNEKYGDRSVVGNVARIHYGQAESRDSSDNQLAHPQNMKFAEDRILARRRHILTADTDKFDEWPETGATSFGTGENEIYEHDSLPLAQWKSLDADAYDDLGGKIIKVCFYERPLVDIEDASTFHKLMCEGVSSFAIQWAYWDDSGSKDELRWFPSDDPDEDGSVNDSHFDSKDSQDQFGVYFNIPNPVEIFDWDAIGDAKIEYDGSNSFPASFHPKAFKFTFRLCDSHGIIEEADSDGRVRKGRSFTHVVYLSD